MDAQIVAEIVEIEAKRWESIKVGMGIIVGVTIASLVGFWTALYGKGDDLHNEIVDASFWFGTIGCVLGVITIWRYTWSLDNPFPRSLMTRMIVGMFFSACATAIILLYVAYKVKKHQWIWFAVVGGGWALSMLHFVVLDHSSIQYKGYQSALISTLSMAMYASLKLEIDLDVNEYSGTHTISGVLTVVGWVLGYATAISCLFRVKALRSPLGFINPADVSTSPFAALCHYITSIMGPLVFILAIYVKEDHYWKAFTIWSVVSLLLLGGAAFYSYHHKDSTPHHDD